MCKNFAWTHAELQRRSTLCVSIDL
jgi:hypothetical protein